MHTDRVRATKSARNMDFARVRMAGPGRCASCGDVIPPFGPAVCTECAGQGYCTVCGQEHRPTQCPLVAQARHDMERAEMLTHKRMVADWAAMLREAYEAMPVWTEAA